MRSDRPALDRFALDERKAVTERDEPLERLLAACAEGRMQFAHANERRMRALRHVGARTHEQRIAASANRCDGGLFDGRAKRLHLEIVGKENPAKAECLAKQRGRDAMRERGRELGVEGRVDDVRSHQRIDARRGRGAKRRQLDSVQAVAITPDRGKLEVRIGGRVAVPRKMFSARRDTTGVEARGEREREACDVFGRLPERAIADHRIGGVRVDVEDGREAARKPQRREIGAQHFARFASHRDAALHARERGHRRQRDHGRAQASDPSAFLIDAHECGRQRVGAAHQRIARFGRSDGDRSHGEDVSAEVTLEEDDAPAFAARELALQVGVERGSIEADDEKLSAQRRESHGHDP